MGDGVNSRTSFIATDLAGAPVNVSSGYTAILILAAALVNTQAASNSGYVDASSAVTFGFAADGTVTLTIDGDAIKDLAYSTQGDAVVQLSNDSGSTYSTAASGQYSLQRVTF